MRDLLAEIPPRLAALVAALCLIEEALLADLKEKEAELAEYASQHPLTDLDSSLAEFRGGRGLVSDAVVNTKYALTVTGEEIKAAKHLLDIAWKLFKRS